MYAISNHQPHHIMFVSESNSKFEYDHAMAVRTPYSACFLASEHLEFTYIYTWYSCQGLYEPEVCADNKFASVCKVESASFVCAASMYALVIASNSATGFISLIQHCSSTSIGGREISLLLTPNLLSHHLRRMDMMNNMWSVYCINRRLPSTS